MSNIKVSSLNAVETLVGTDLLLVVQTAEDGVTLLSKKMSVNDIKKIIQPGFKNVNQSSQAFDTLEQIGTTAHYKGGILMDNASVSLSAYPAVSTLLHLPADADGNILPHNTWVEVSGSGTDLAAVTHLVVYSTPDQFYNIEAKSFAPATGNPSYQLTYWS